MKKILLFALAIISLQTKSQILNPSFESVTANKPNNWNTNFYNYSSYQIRDTSASHTGSHAAYIRGLSGASYSVQGAALGVFSTVGLPSSVQGWYKCNIVAGDSLVFNPYLYQTTTNSPYAIAYSYTTSSTSVYKQFTASFNFTTFPITSADTVFVSIYLSGQSFDAQGVHIPVTGTWAIIDDVTMGPDINTGIKETVIEDGIEKVYPQPSSNMAFMIYNLTETSVCELKLFDVTGKEIKTIFNEDKQTPGKYKAEIPVYDLPQGVYIAQLKVNGQIRTAKIVKQ
ncbi:MAG: T9SS type A sorting domain-containing protein [Bacteroidetes bacterium]|nr:T9SS type A sorting domain-containing protein [Bacteroidota bacterium]